MKKTIIALAVAAAMVPALAAAEGASISGFNDITLKSDNDQTTFNASTEIDVRSTVGAVTVGADLDIDLGAGATNLEQAFFAWGAAENLTVIGGVFNNPIGLEGEDSTDINTATHGQIYNILDGQTALDGNNIAGLAVAYNAGVATVTVALLNDIRGTNNESNSIALVVNASPVENLNLELGYVTQDDKQANGTSTEDLTNTGTLSSVANVGSAGNVINLNATYDIAGATLGFEYLAADNVVDSAIGLHAAYKVNDKVGVNFRYDVVAYGSTAMGTDIGALAEDTTSTTLSVKYKIADNLSVKAEYKISDDSVLGTNNTVDDEVAKIKFVATF